MFLFWKVACYFISASVTTFALLFPGTVKSCLFITQCFDSPCVSHSLIHITIHWWLVHLPSTDHVEAWQGLQIELHITADIYRALILEGAGSKMPKAHCCVLDKCSFLIYRESRDSWSVGGWVSIFFFCGGKTSLLPRLVRTMRNTDLILSYCKPGSNWSRLFGSLLQNIISLLKFRHGIIKEHNSNIHLGFC